MIYVIILPAFVARVLPPPPASAFLPCLALCLSLLPFLFLIVCTCVTVFRIKGLECLNEKQ